MKITVGTAKQIAYANEIIARRAHEKMGGNLYCLEAGLKWIEEYRSTIANSEAPQDLKAAAFDLLDKLPAVAVFWITGAGDHTARAIEAVLSSNKAVAHGADAFALYVALTA